MTVIPQPVEARLVTEATRLCRRYIDEFVLHFDLCPWAAPALQAGRVQITVLTDVLVESEDAHPLIAKVVQQLTLAASRTDVELVLLVFPRCSLDRLAFERFQRDLRDAMQEPTDVGMRSAFALAAFHPDAPLDLQSPERLIPYLRRSPDPLLQAIRTTTLHRLEPTNPSGTGFVTPEQLLALTVPLPQHPSLRLRVARANLATFHERGGQEMEEKLADIFRDREACYASIFTSAPLPRQDETRRSSK